jgi:hypothetical protein
MADDATTIAETKAEATTAAPAGAASAGISVTETKPGAAAEAKPVETEAIETKAVETKTADAASADAVPDYSTLKIPEGYKVDDPAYLEATRLFAEARIPAELAQKLVDHVVARDRAGAERNARAWSDTVGRWQGELKASLGDSKEFTGASTGGDRLKEVQALAAKAIVAYGGEDAAAITQHMKTYALGDFGPLARFMARVGRTVTEDVPVRPNGAATGSRTAQQLYSNSNMSE